MHVVGLDGWRGGWIAVSLEDGRFRSAEVFESASHVLDAHSAAAVIAADIPIGLPSTGRRRADVMARARLGARRSSVFFCPPRGVLEIDTYAAANALAKEKHNFGISKQSYMLRPKILEVDGAIAAGAVIYESHPELAFQAISGSELPSKKTYAGQRAREAALRSVGIELPDDLGPAGVVPVDDVLDAAVVAYVAHRIDRGGADSLPSRPPLDAHGRQMAIWF